MSSVENIVHGSEKGRVIFKKRTRRRGEKKIIIKKVPIPMLLDYPSF